MHRFAMLAFVILSACAGTDRPATVDPYAPSAVDRQAEAVDGLLVGDRLMEAGLPELALKAYLRSAAEQGITPDVLAALGSANLELGRLGQAETLLRRATELDPGLSTAQNNLGVVLLERGRPADAVRAFRAARASEDGPREDIETNLALALAKVEESTYPATARATFALERRGSGHYVIRSPS